MALSPNDWLVLSSILPLRVCDIRDLCFMCGLKLSDVLVAVRSLRALGLIRRGGSLIYVTEPCVRLMMGSMSKSRVRLWLLVECFEGFEGMLRDMGFIGRGVKLFAPLSRLMLDYVEDKCLKIVVCSSKLLSSVWTLIVGGLTPWSSLSSSIEARDRALMYLKMRSRGFAFAVKSSVEKLIESYVIADSLNPNVDVHDGLQLFKTRFNIDLSPLFNMDFTFENPLEAISLLDRGLNTCRSFLEHLMRDSKDHPRFHDINGFDVDF